MKKLVIDDKFDNKKLNQFVFYKFPYLKKNMFYKALRQKDFKINSKRISNENEILYGGDILEIYIDDKYLIEPDFKIDIIYEDSNILIANKPSRY